MQKDRRLEARPPRTVRSRRPRGPQRGRALRIRAPPRPRPWDCPGSRGWCARGRRKWGSAELFLGGVEVSVFLVERERGERLAFGFRELGRPVDAVREAPGH